MSFKRSREILGIFGRETLMNQVCPLVSTMSYLVWFGSYKALFDIFNVRTITSTKNLKRVLSDSSNHWNH